MSDTNTKTAEVKKKSNPIVLILIVAVLGGGGFGAWKFLWHPATSAEAKENGKENSKSSDDGADRKKSKKKQVKSVVHLESFVVNLTGEGETGYLRVGIDLGTGTEESSGEGEKKKNDGATAMIRDTVLTVLGKTKSAELLLP